MSSHLIMKETKVVIREKKERRPCMVKVRVQDAKSVEWPATEHSSVEKWTLLVQFPKRATRGNASLRRKLAMEVLKLQLKGRMGVAEQEDRRREHIEERNERAQVRRSRERLDMERFRMLIEIISKLVK